MSKIKYLLIAFITSMLSCNYNSEAIPSCTKVQLHDDDFTEMVFKDLPDVIKSEIVQLAAKRKKMDTAYSLNNGTIYSYHNPGDGKGYLEQIQKNKDMHYINNKCYEFLLKARTYILYENKIYFMKQYMVENCSDGEYLPDTTGLSEKIFLSLSLDKIIEN